MEKAGIFTGSYNRLKGMTPGSLPEEFISGQPWPHARFTGIWEASGYVARPAGSGHLLFWLIALRSP
jgi:hypothetical protein